MPSAVNRPVPPRAWRVTVAVAAVLAVLLGAAPVHAADGGEAARTADGGEAAYAAALALIDEHRDEAARTRLLEAAHAGHVRAAATLGMMALLSPRWAGNEPTATFARRWLGRAAIDGDAAASRVLASMNAGGVRFARRDDAR